MLDMHVRPSQIMEIDDVYTAFCFDEACALIVTKLQNKEIPIIKEESEVNYTKPSDVYKKFQQ